MSLWLVAVMPAANLPVGSTFVILNKTSAGPIAGTFAGRPQGSVVSVNGNVTEVLVPPPPGWG